MMLIRLTMPGVLLALCVVIHALVMTGLLHRLSRSAAHRTLRFWAAIRALIQLAMWIVAAHMFEIAIWASFYVWLQAFPDMKTSFYFSAVTYTTVGYGDVVLPENWRLFAAVEGLTGILMCGWSAGVFFAVVSRIYSLLSAETKGVDEIAGR